MTTTIHPDLPQRSRRHTSLASLAWQGLLIAAVIGIVGGAAWNAADALARQGISSGFGFLGNTAGFDISQHYIAYSAVSTYAGAFAVGLLNTLVVSIIAIPIATVLGFVIGILRRSPNWLLSKVAAAYVELFRNTPLLLQLLFWYNAVLAALPASVAESVRIGDAVYINRRGLSIPEPVLGPLFSLTAVALVFAVLFVAWLRRWARRRHEATGRGFPLLAVAMAILVGLPAAAALTTGQITGAGPIGFEFPTPGRFSVEGGWQLLPEFVALLIGLVAYTAASIAEVVRSGLAAVQQGQYEAARALHLTTFRTLQLVVVPQAIRVIIPPLTNQYLNLFKNSSLAVAIGYPDLVQVFAGTVLNQTGQAVEIVLMTMAVYLAISLITSAGMNHYNRRVRLVER